MKRSKLKLRCKAYAQWRYAYQKARLAWPSNQFGKDRQVEVAKFIFTIRKRGMSEKLLRDTYLDANMPTLREEPFTYLLCSDASIHCTRGGRWFLKDWIHQQFPALGESIGTLVYSFDPAYQMNGLTAIVCTKNVALKLRELYRLLLTQGTST